MQKRWRVEQIPIAIRQGQREASKETRPFQAARRFTEDHFPGIAARMAWCSRSFEFQEDQLRPGYVKRLPRRCHQVPFCIICSRVAAVRRTCATLDKFSRCTPGGMQPRFIHVVQMAPLTEDGQGWGARAAKDIAGFARVVMRALEEEFGKGIGVMASYHDFGERGLAKCAPHLDMTLNGWMLDDGTPKKTPRIELKGAGRDRFDELVVKHAQTLQIGARRGNVDFTSVRVGRLEYYKILKYQMRELVDFRKLDYSRSAKAVAWKSYRNNTRTAMTVDDFLDALAEYQQRLGHWHAGPGGQRLHRALGHMADRSIKQTQKAMGGDVPPHGRQCVCSRCGDWTEYELTEEEELMNLPRRSTGPMPAR